jgi:cytochrome P450
LRVRAGVHVQYPWARHRLPDVFDDPDAFRPERIQQLVIAAETARAYTAGAG